MGKEAARYTEEEFAQRECVGQPYEVFFPLSYMPKEERAENLAVARKICDICIIRDGCLPTALDRGEVQGIYSGVDLSDHSVRKSLRRQYRKELEEG